MVDTNAKLKFPEKDRNFETRLIFILELFENKFDSSTIMTSCIQHKLGRSFEQYLEKVETSVWRLHGEDPMDILKRIDRE